MKELTKYHIELALASDPEVDPLAKKKALAILAGEAPKRKLITTRQACEILDGCHPLTLRRIEKRGHLQAVRFSARKLRWIESQVREFANNGIPVQKGESA